MHYTKIAFLPILFFSIYIAAQEPVNLANRNGELQSALNGGGMGAAYPYGYGLNSYGRNWEYNNNNPTLRGQVYYNGFPSGSGKINSRPDGEYKFIASTLNEGNYWILILKDSNNIIRMKGSYSDQELTTPEGMFYYYHSNGNISMSGLYKQGLRNGIWISTYANGKLKDSISYWNGQKNGKFQRYHLNGSLYISGIYVEDNMHGTWFEYYQDNQPASITNYRQGKINTIIYYTKSGEKIEQGQNKQLLKLFFNRRCEIVQELINANFYGTPFKMANGNTACVLYDMEGNKIVSVQWSDPALSRKSGRFEQYDTTGILRFTCNYDNNQLTGTLKSWYKTGVLADSGNMKKNMRDGIWESWYESGRKKDSGAFVNDVPKDLWVHWDENGLTKTLGSYGKNGKTGDWKTYNKNGKILYIQRYRKSTGKEPEKIVINNQ